MSIGASPDGLASALKHLRGYRVKGTDVYDREEEHTIWNIIEVVVMWSFRSRDVVCPTCLRSRNVSVEITFSVTCVQGSDDFNTCSACVGCELLVNVLVLADAVKSAKV